MHACHHGIASNYGPLEATSCYLMLHYVMYGWTGSMFVKPPGAYEFIRAPEPNWDLLPSREITLKAASLILFGEHPKPRAVIKELEGKWLPRGTKVRYVH